MKIQTLITRGSITKCLLTLTAALGIAVLGTSVAKANILANPYLDQIGITSQANACPLQWTVDAYLSFSGPLNDGGDSETFCNVSPPSDPNGYGFFFKPFHGTVGPPEDLCNVALYQDNPCSANTKVTLSADVSCEANYSGLAPYATTNSPAPQTLFFVEFFDGSNVPLQTNTWDLVANGMNTGGPSSMALMTMPQQTAPLNTAKVRCGILMQNTFSTFGGQSFFADNFDLETVAPAGSPIITNNPSSTTTSVGGNASFTVGVSNVVGATYQWQHNSTNISNGGEYSGVTAATLNITGASTSDIGFYRVIVSNGLGANYSTAANLALDSTAINPVVWIYGSIGATYEVDYATAGPSGPWTPFSTNKLSTLPQPVVDNVDGRVGQRYYRVLYQFGP